MLIIFDLDDTLIDTSYSVTPFFLKKILTALIKQGLQIDENVAYKKLIQINEKSISSSQAIKFFLYDLKAKNSFFDIAKQEMALFSIDDIKIFTIKNAKSILKYLSKTHRLAIVTCGREELQLNKIKKAGIDTSIFSKIVISTKKDKQPHYKKIIEELRCDINQTYVCGDRVKIDLMSAKKIGCKTIHMMHGRGKNIFSKKDSKFVDYTITDLEEIKTILDNKN